MRRIAAPIVVLVVALLTVSPAFAEVSDLRPAALTANDAPAGYTHPHFKVFTHFVSKMTIKTKNTGGIKGTSSSSCKVARSFKTDGFQSGMIEVFKTKAILFALQLCGYQFATETGAHTAFLADSASLQKQGTKNNYTPLPGATVGDESLGLEASSQGLSLYALSFRHTNAVIDILYLGPSSYTPDQFVQAVTSSNSRLP